MKDINILNESEVMANHMVVEPNAILHGNCLELMKYIPEKSIHLILTDLPYG